MQAVVNDVFEALADLIRRATFELSHAGGAMSHEPTKPHREEEEG
jgi:hypothetical protein